MRKILILSLILVFALGILAGCSQPKKPEAPATGQPTKPGDEKSEGGIDYIVTYTMNYSLKDNPEPGEIVEMQEMKAPQEAALIIFKVSKNEKAPEDQETEVLLMDGDKIIAEQVIMSKELKDKDVIVKLHKDGGRLEPGEYKIVVKPKKGKGMIEKTFTVTKPGEDTTKPELKDDKKVDDTPDEDNMEDDSEKTDADVKTDDKKTDADVKTDDKKTDADVKTDDKKTDADVKDADKKAKK